MTDQQKKRYRLTVQEGSGVDIQSILERNNAEDIDVFGPIATFTATEEQADQIILEADSSAEIQDLGSPTNDTPEV